ncbi:Toxin RTX-I translocation ATP-binding protein [compost metagenome]
MDKVLVHRGLTTLDVLIIGLVVVVVFESLLTGLRAYVLSHTTSRIDVELGARLFRIWCSCRWPTSRRAAWAIRWRACASWRTSAIS